MILALHVTPKAPRSAIVGWAADAEGRPVLKVKVAAPPEDGKANAELVKFLAKEWSVSKSALEIVSGETARHKRLKIHDDALAARLLAAVIKA
jgi:uncharacterized protein